MDANCRECGKTFRSWKALFGHMKCHAVTGRDCRNLISDNEGTTRPLCKRKKRSDRAKRYCTFSNTNSSSLTFADGSMSVSDVDLQEQEEVALSLILLSRDVNCVIESIGTANPKFLEHEKFVKTEVEQSMTSPLVDNKNLEIGSSEVSSPKNWIDKIGFGSEQFKSNCKKLKSSSSKKFMCIVCRKVFASYQALGGHRASRKKFKGCCAQTESFSNPTDKIIEGKIDAEANGRKKSTNRECPICFKVFPSGQALGGHKRSHLVTPDHQMRSTVDPSIGIALETTKEVQNFLDLNLPAPSEEGCNEFEPWWIGISLVDPTLKSSSLAL